MVGAEEQDDFENRKDVLSMSIQLSGDPQEIRRHGGGMIRCRR